MATLIDLSREIDEIFHELSPRERMRVMRNTMSKIGREIRRQATADLSALNYTPKGPVRKGKTSKARAKSLRKNIMLVPYRRAIGFHVTVASRRAKAGGHTKVDHQNRWGRWVPAARWLDTGTRRQEARPFMDNAARKLDNYEARITQVFNEKLEDIVKKHNAKH